MLSVTLKIYLIALHTSLAGMLWGLDTGEFQECLSARLDDSGRKVPSVLSRKWYNSATP